MFNLKYYIMKYFFTQLMRSGSLLLLGILGTYFTAIAQDCGPADGQTKVVKIEAEDYVTISADNIIKIQTGNSDYVSGGKYINEIYANSWVTYDLTAPYEGSYQIGLFYYNAGGSRPLNITVNNQTPTRVNCPGGSSSWGDGDNPGFPVCAVFTIYMSAGQNTIKLGGAGDFGPNLDYFEIYTTDDVVEKPDVAPNLYQWSYAREIPKGTITANLSPDDAQNIFDEDEDTYYEATGGDASITWEFEYPMSLTGMLVYTDDGDAKVSDWLVLRSADGIEWNEMTVFSRGSYGKSQTFGLDLDDDGQSRKPQYRDGFESKYFKIMIPQGAKINEIQFFGYPVQAHDTYLYYPENLAGSAYLYMEDPFADGSRKTVVDDNNGVLLVSNTGLDDGTFLEDYTSLLDRFPDQYTVLDAEQGGTIEIEYDFADFIDVNSYSLAICEEKFPNRNPMSWQFLGSSDFGDTWDVLDEVTDFKWPQADYMNMKFDIPEHKTGYIYYKFVFTGSNSWTWDFNMSEFQLFGDHLTTQTSIKQVNKDTQNILVYAVKDAIVLSKADNSPAQYQIYDITGRKVAQGFTKDVNTTVPVNKGIFIVRTSSSSSSKVTKVIVR